MPRKSNARRRTPTSLQILMLLLQILPLASFLIQPHVLMQQDHATTGSSSSSALQVWWFGGSASEEEATNGNDSCELVAVRIERTSPQSRRILGEIVAPVPLLHVWAILTDYNRLSTHVPNLIESKIVNGVAKGQPGDGSYHCRLFQRGAQKIVGFDFSASVTMDMQEEILAMPTVRHSGNRAPQRDAPVNGDDRAQRNPQEHRHERRIKFKCVESMFFSEFDGEWRVREQRIPDGSFETVLSYTVDVRPKGPVPVQALEWRIREDVPTNLRAVKKAAMTVGQRVLASKPQTGISPRLKVHVQWDQDETMAAYLEEP